MLEELYVSQFALVDNLRLALGGGLNVLTGETGAGKSILVDAMGLLLGGRASAEWIRQGAERALVEGRFSLAGAAAARLRDTLETLGLPVEEDGSLWLSREIARNGRNTCRVNGRPVPLSAYQEVGGPLVDIHGQHEHQSLLSPARQLDLLDAFGGPALAERLAAVREAYRRVSALRRELAAVAGDERERIRRRDLLAFQVEEIAAAGFHAGEEEELLARRQVLAAAERLRTGAERARQLLWSAEGAAGEALGQALGILRELAATDEAVRECQAGVEAAYYQVEEAARFLQRYAERLQEDPAALEEVEQRLELLRRLKRKYGSTLAEVLAFAANARAELAALEGAEERAGELEAAIREAEEQYRRDAAALAELRRQAARRLEGEVNALLGDLDMPGARFIAALAEREGGPGGTDGVEFLFSANQGEEPRPLARVASGGELGRLMLALKNVLAEQDDTPTLIFDEIDAGVGGRAAKAVAGLLGEVARHRQVICVTHLAQIASRGRLHLHVRKEVAGGRTVTRVDVLSGKAREEELARMLDGAATPVALEHARALLRSGAEA